MTYDKMIEALEELELKVKDVYWNCDLEDDERKFWEAKEDLKILKKVFGIVNKYYERT